jgi:hypothetical protein
MRNSPTNSRRVRSAHESKSATARAAAAAPSRRQLSHWQREQHQQRRLYIAIGGLLVLVLGTFAGGFIFDNLVRANQTVAQIGPDSITAAQLLDEVKPQARQLDSQAKQLGSASNITNYLDQQKRSLPDQVLNDQVDQHIIQQEADRRGISVSSTELEDKERQTVADFQAATNPSPTPEPIPTPEAAATPETVLTSATPQLPTPAAVSSPTTPTAVPTLEDSTYGPALQQLLDRNSLTEADFRKQLQRSLLRERLQSAIGQEQLPDTQAPVLGQDPASGVPADQLLSQRQKAFSDWLSAQRSGAAITLSLDQGEKNWVLARIGVHP